MFLAEVLIPLFVKMALTALIVVSASVAAERAGPAVGGVILSLPVAAGPAYFFLALQAEDTFVAGSAFYSFAAQAATVLFIAAYARVAPRLGAAASLAAATAVWFAAVLLARALAADWWAVLAINALAFLAAFPLAGRPRWPAGLGAVRPGRRDLALRALLAGGVVASVVSLSHVIGPAATGFGLVYPVTLTTLGWIMHRRYGGEAAAALLAGSLRAMVGFVGFLAAMYFLAVPLGAGWALLVAVGVSVAWALLLLGLRPAAPARSAG